MTRNLNAPIAKATWELFRCRGVKRENNSGGALLLLARGSPSSRQEFVAAIVRPEIDDSIRAWAALRPAPVESRFDALHATGLTELVGREEELELLLRRWLKAKTGEGQVVLLSGEAGIGKSHFDCCAVGTPRWRAAHATSLLLFTAAHRQRALSDHQPMERAAGFTHDDNTQAKLDNL